MGSLFSAPKIPQPKAMPAAPTQADASVQTAGSNQPTGLQSYISGGSVTALRRKTGTAKGTLLGGGGA